MHIYVCALACFSPPSAGSVVRNYFARVDPTQPHVLGQRAHAQLNNLDLLQEKIENGRHNYFTVENGTHFLSLFFLEIRISRDAGVGFQSHHRLVPPPHTFGCSRIHARDCVKR
jgi:hypothetical protein